VVLSGNNEVTLLQYQSQTGLHHSPTTSLNYS